MVKQILMALQKHTTHKLGIKTKPSTKTDKRQQGDNAEGLALSYFKRKGFKLIERNFNCPLGEIDLIMNDQDYLVFIEVRHRQNLSFGGALESITASKQAKCRRAAQIYLQSIKNIDCPCRFDILCVTGNLQQPEYHWISNAF